MPKPEAPDNEALTNALIDVLGEFRKERERLTACLPCSQSPLDSRPLFRPNSPVLHPCSPRNCDHDRSRSNRARVPALGIYRTIGIETCSIHHENAKPFRN